MFVLLDPFEAEIGRMSNKNLECIRGRVIRAALVTENSEWAKPLVMRPESEFWRDTSNRMQGAGKGQRVEMQKEKENIGTPAPDYLWAAKVITY